MKWIAVWLLPLHVLAMSEAAFTDVPADVWFAPYVNAALKEGIVSGYVDSDGNLTMRFGPADNVTLAQALKIAVFGAGYNPAAYTEECLPENPPWYMQFECVSQAEHIRPFIGALWECYQCAADAQMQAWNAPATRKQIAEMIAHAFKVALLYDNSPFSDITDSPHISSLVRDGVVTGDTDAEGKPVGRFRPNDSINRAETAKLIMRARERYGMPGKNRTLRNARIDFNTTVRNVRYRDDGFDPAILSITQGTTVDFCNESILPLKIVSNIPKLNAQAEVSPGGPSACSSLQFKFMDTGTFHLHNKNDLSMTATIVVEAL